MTAGAAAAIANAMDDSRELRLRTTLRRDDVHVWTTFLPTYDLYETMLVAPSDVITRCEGLALTFPNNWSCDTAQFRRRDSAISGHRAVCDHVESVLRAVRS